MTNLDSILKSRDTALPTKLCLVKTMVFSVVMNGGESWTIKKAEDWRTDAFELWCCRRLLRVPWTARRSNQSVLKEISPEHSLEALMLKLKLQYFGHLMWRLLGKDPDAGKDWRRVKKGMTEDGWMASPTRWRWVWTSFGSWWWTGKHGMPQFMGSQSQTRLSDWTKLMIIILPFDHGFTIFEICFLNLPLLDKGFPGDSVGKESACNVGDLGFIPGL